MANQPYDSPLDYVSEGFHAAAVYCSDGRFGGAIDDFLTNGLQLPRVDRVALPGGPASIAGYDQARLPQAGVLAELTFLVEAHELERVVLIQHAGCAYYGAFLGVDAEHLPTLQRADLVRAAHFLRGATPQATVEGWVAQVDGAKMTFEPVDLD